ncbi:hypothetical protein A0H81_08642 [Grifola frondosa]|uniref:Arrestin-like N-terminal domain-containing protein n=1 Tax=Grifola frondosa TaxID=5627 RepID=A0A1C7M3K7_GRIFR|nr:hypothetical protein A0H81_08642 [Grifola frondosa]
MSTTSLPSYVAPSLARIPSYSAEPHAYEQRLALNRLRAPPAGDFVKQSRGGSVSLRLIEQEDNASLPMYGCGAAVEGTVDLAKTDGVTTVEVKIEGTLRLKEIAEGGTTTNSLCLSKVVLWSKDRDAGPCPLSLPFSLTLPTTFSDGKDNYPLPPTHEAHLSGVPGFKAAIDYSVSATVHKSRATSLLRLGNSSVSTPFIYYPRSRPATPIPRPLSPIHGTSHFLATPDWKCYECRMKAQIMGGKDIKSSLYLPTSRVFCISQPIPFHITFSSSAFSLAAFMPYGPTASILAPNKQFTQIKLLRQSTVDVRNALVLGTKTDIWSVVNIGEGVFSHAGDGSDWISFVGEIRVHDQIKVGGFKAGGFSIKVCPSPCRLYPTLHDTPEPAKAPFGELRQVIPVRLTTDPWSDDGMLPANFSASPTPPEEAQGLHPSYSRTRWPYEGLGVRGAM